MKSQFYNTINLSGPELTAEQVKNLKQTEMLLRFLKNNPDKRFSPSQLHKLVCKTYHIKPPLTSIRRALTDLTNDGLIIKTDYKVKGLYHLPEHTWTIKITPAA